MLNNSHAFIVEIIALLKGGHFVTPSTHALSHQKEAKVFYLLGYKYFNMLSWDL